MASLNGPAIDKAAEPNYSARVFIFSQPHCISPLFAAVRLRRLGAPRADRICQPAADS